MGTGAPASGDDPTELRLDGGGRASLVTAEPGADPAGLLSRLGLGTGRPVVVLLGGPIPVPDDPLTPTTGLPAAALVEAAEVAGAAIVDGGTATGAAAQVGAAAADSAAKVPLVGVVAADGDPPLEPHHRCFVRVREADEPTAARLLADLAAALAGGAPVVAVLAGGGSAARSEALEAARRHWPMLVVGRTGGTADDVVRWWHTARERRPGRIARLAARLRRRRQAPGGEPPVVDAVLASIVAHGDLRLVDGDEPAELTRLLSWELQDGPVLKLAWERFACYDAAAARLRRGAGRLQRSVLLLGVAVTLAALLQHTLADRPGRAWPAAGWALHWTVVAIPVLIAALLAGGDRFGPGRRWRPLLAAARAVEQEVFRHRTRTGAYRGDGREAVLVERLAAVDADLLRTEAAAGSLPAWTGPLPPPGTGLGADDGLSPLDPGRYLAVRLAGQLDGHRGGAVRLERHLRRLQLLTLAAGAAGTLLAAAGFELWVALTTVLATASMAHLGYLQADTTLLACNQAAARLEAARARWLASPTPDRFPDLVDATESAVGGELAAWLPTWDPAPGRDAGAPGGARHVPHLTRETRAS